MQTNKTFADIQKMKKGKDVYERIVAKVQGESTELFIRPLTQDEKYQCTISGRTLAKNNCGIAYREGEDDLIYTIKELLADSVYMVTEKGDYLRFFLSADEVGTLYDEEVIDMFSKYTKVQEKISPSSLETEKDFEDLIEEVKKKSVTGMYLSMSTAEKLLQYLIDRTQNSQKDSGITSTPSNLENESLKEPVTRRRAETAILSPKTE